MAANRSHHTLKLRRDAEQFARAVGYHPAMSAYRQALKTAIRRGNSDDAADLAYKLAYLARRQRPSGKYVIQISISGAYYLTLHTADGELLTFADRTAAEHHAAAYFAEFKHVRIRERKELD